MEVKNIIQPQIKSTTINDEVFETILKRDNVVIERIISTGQVTPIDTWYDQEKDEWVLLLQGTAILSFEKNKKINLKVGDYLLIPAHEKHRVEYTSSTPACIWLAVYIKK